MPSQRCPASCQTWSAERHRSVLKSAMALAGLGLAKRAQPDRAQSPGDFGPVDRHDLAQGVCVPHLVDGAERRVFRQALFELLHPAGEHVGRGGVGGHLPPRLALAGRGLSRGGHPVHPGRPQSQHDVGSGRVPARLRLSFVGVLGHELPPWPQPAAPDGPRGDPRFDLIPGVLFSIVFERFQVIAVGAGALGRRPRAARPQCSPARQSARRDLVRAFVASGGADAFRPLKGAEIKTRFSGKELTDGVHWSMRFGNGGRLTASEAVGRFAPEEKGAQERAPGHARRQQRVRCADQSMKSP